MSITPSDKLSGILPVIISGGRPELKQRPTSSILPELKGITAPPVWIVSEKDAPAYQDDGNEISVYTRDWAEDYASTHWTGIDPLIKGEGSFMGAFPGREWACRLAEERGYWAVLQLDDNIIDLSLFRRHYTSNSRIARDEGGLGMFADVLAAITLSTNGHMVGAFLTAVPPSGNEKLVVSRTGFPYSLFLERVGPGREDWNGPYEDDITHAYQYGSNPSSATALLVPMLNYMKEHSSDSGMRKNYNSKRAVPLQRMFPETARLGVYQGKANGRGGPRVFHKMIPGAIRTPMVITDRPLYGEVKAYITALARKFGSEYRQELDTRLSGRAQKAKVMRSLTDGVLPPAPAPEKLAPKPRKPRAKTPKAEPEKPIPLTPDQPDEPTGTAPWWDTPTWLPSH